jgi:hypothetical protein
MLELVDESEVYKREYIKKNKIKGTVPNNLKWVVNQSKKLEKMKVFGSEKVENIVGSA